MNRLITSTIRALGLAADDDRHFAAAGFNDHRVATRYVDALSDADLSELNGLLRWHCFTVDSHGRRFGRRSKPGKREDPQPVPDPRIIELDRRFKLAGKTVLEVGCFEGVHTTGLALLGARVTGVDSRMENVVKTIVRTAMFGCEATVLKCNVEIDSERQRLAEVDLLHHVGVLYHLTDPVSHLRLVGALAREGVMLDTHYAEPHEATSTYEVDGTPVPYRRLDEGGQRDVFSGMYDHAKWLTLDTIDSVLRDMGFDHIDVAEKRAERNGPRVLLFARRS